MYVYNRDSILIHNFDARWESGKLLQRAPKPLCRLHLAFAQHFDLNKTYPLGTKASNMLLI
jgi:hypothetical protein